MALLHSRLLALWVMLAVSGAATAFLLLEFYRQSANAQVSRAKEAVSRACREIGDRYTVFLAGLRGSTESTGTPEAQLLSVVSGALARAPGVEGGLWRQGEGSLAYAFPTYEGTGPKTDLPAAELENIRKINADAARAGLPITIHQVGRSQVLAVNACPLPRPLHGVTAWAMTRVFTGQGPAYNQLLVGLAILALTVLGSAVWLGHILYGWSRKLIGLKRPWRHDLQTGDLPKLPLVGERELDRLVRALNATGARLAEERRRSGAAERLAAVGRVAAGLAHEIRNPIAAMRLKAENALAVDEKERREFGLNFMLQQIGRLDGLLRDLLAMTQRREPKLAETISLSSSNAPRMRIERSPPPRASSLWSDRRQRPHHYHFFTEQMHRAIDNLILNAIESTPTGGVIEVHTERRNSALAFCVCDTGSGVPHDIREGLFEPFVTGRSDGTGLGLNNRARYCPGAWRRGAVCADKPRCQVRDRNTMANVLIVDDDAALREGLAETVADLGHAPFTAASGREALAAISAQDVDYVFLDLRMPGGMDGIAVLRRIREREAPPAVVVLTAFATAENTIEAMRLGAFDHLTKPIGRQELAALLSRLPRLQNNPSSDEAREHGGLVGSSEAMRRVQKTIGLVADSDATVLIGARQVLARNLSPARCTTTELQEQAF